MAKENNNPSPKKDYLRLAYKGKEYLWLAFTIISLILAIYNLLTNESDYATYFIVMTFLAGIFYSFYRHRHKKYKEYMAGKEK